MFRISFLLSIVFSVNALAQLPPDLAYVPAYFDQQQMINTHGTSIDDTRGEIDIEFEALSSASAAYLDGNLEIITHFGDFRFFDCRGEESWSLYPRRYFLRYDTPSGTQEVIAWDTWITPPNLGYLPQTRAFSANRNETNYVFAIDLTGKQASNLRFVVAGTSFAHRTCPRPLPVRTADMAVSVTRVEDMDYLDSFPVWFDDLRSPAWSSNAQCDRYGPTHRIPSIICARGNDGLTRFVAENPSSATDPVTVSKTFYFNRGALGGTNQHYFSCYGYSNNLLAAGKMGPFTSTSYGLYNMSAVLHIDNIDGSRQSVPFQSFNKGGEIDVLISSTDLAGISIDALSDVSVEVSAVVPPGNSWSGQGIFWLADNNDPTLAGIEDRYLPSWWVPEGDPIPPQQKAWYDNFVSVNKNFYLLDFPTVGSRWDIFMVEASRAPQCDIFLVQPDAELFAEVLWQLDPPLIYQTHVTATVSMGRLPSFSQAEYAYIFRDFDEVGINRQTYTPHSFTVPDPDTIEYPYGDYYPGRDFINPVITRIWVSTFAALDETYISMQLRPSTTVRNRAVQTGKVDVPVMMPLAD